MPRRWERERCQGRKFRRVLSCDELSGRAAIFGASREERSRCSPGRRSRFPWLGSGWRRAAPHDLRWRQALERAAFVRPPLGCVGWSTFARLFCREGARGTIRSGASAEFEEARSCPMFGRVRFSLDGAADATRPKRRVALAMQSWCARLRAVARGANRGPLAVSDMLAAH